MGGGFYKRILALRPPPAPDVWGGARTEERGTRMGSLARGFCVGRTSVSDKAWVRVGALLPVAFWLWVPQPSALGLAFFT